MLHSALTCSSIHPSTIIPNGCGVMPRIRNVVCPPTFGKRSMTQSPTLFNDIIYYDCHGVSIFRIIVVHSAKPYKTYIVLSVFCLFSSASVRLMYLSLEMKKTSFQHVCILAARINALLISEAIILAKSYMYAHTYAWKHTYVHTCSF